jgi:hypothetical protein
MSLSGPDTQNWLAGQRPAGAAYVAGEHVVIQSGPVGGRAGTIVLLADLEPEPRYLIEIAPGHYVQVPQSDLIHSD